jgi:hypothetical protein
MTNRGKRTACCFAGIMAVGGVTVVYGQPKAAKSASSQAVIEAMAVQSLISNAQPVQTLPTICRYLVGSTNLVLAEAWKRICDTKVIPPPLKNCIKDFFLCLNKESIGNAPPGGSFQCEDRLKKCQSSP